MTLTAEKANDRNHNRVDSNGAPKEHNGDSGRRVEEEIVAAAVIVPPDGGWGWVVVAASFLTNAVVDGLIFTVGQGFLPLWEEQLTDNSASMAAWCVSLLSGCYLLVGPLVSAVANIFGCRMTAIVGAVLAALGFLISSFADNIYFLYVSFGLLGGIGLGFLYLPSIVIVSYYFEKRRALATGIAVCGSGIGTFIFAPLIGFLLSVMSWQNTMRLMAGVVLLCILFATFYRTLQPTSQQISKVEEKLHEYEETKERKKASRPASYHQESSREPQADHKSLLLPSNLQFERFDREDADPVSSVDAELLPSDLIRQRALSTGQRVFRSSMDLSIARKHRSTVTNNNSGDLAAAVSKRSVTVLNRPLSRMDIFYAGSVERLPQFKSQPDVRHFLASTLSIPAAAAEVRDTAQAPQGESTQKDVKSTLKSVLDYSLFASPTFVLLALSGFFTLTGFFVPFIYLRKMARTFGHSEARSTFLVSALGITNIVARILCGYISDRPNADPLLITNVALVLAGAATAIVPHCQSYALLILYCGVFGMGTACFASLRSVICVNLLGLEKLTNAFGLLLLFMGIASLIGTPIAGTLFDLTKTFNLSFYVMGALVAFSGVLGFFLPAVNRWEKRRDASRMRLSRKVSANLQNFNVPQIYEPSGTALPETVREEDEDNLPNSNSNTIHAKV